jgi:Mlc titration factor MtfA (ptsG expression regulator)
VFILPGRPGVAPLTYDARPMFAWLRHWRRRRHLRRGLVSESDFTYAVECTPSCAGLNSDERERLRQLTTVFLREKVFVAANHADIAPPDRLLIAVNACLPVLNLGLDAYGAWVTVIVYPDAFLVDYDEQDEAGVVHSGRDLREGEAWQRGPLVISLGDVHAQSAWEDHNVVIHECAHKLDMRNGRPDGFPPLHRGMSAEQWTQAFTEAYTDLRGRVERDEETPIDAYAAESPAECFAVFSEYFFEAPQRLRNTYPTAYSQLVQFYRQDPLERSQRTESALATRSHRLHQDGATRTQPVRRSPS